MQPWPDRFVSDQQIKVNHKPHWEAEANSMKIGSAFEATMDPQVAGSAALLGSKVLRCVRAFSALHLWQKR